MLVRRLREAGATLLPGTEVVGGLDGSREVVLQTSRGEVAADVVVTCAGLHADQVARLLGHEPSVRIIPFRGEYRSLTPDAAHLVLGLVYPVPDPTLPFLGVHLTRGVDGDVHAGPNAVLALAREGYGWRAVSAHDLAGVLGYAGFWRLARTHRRSSCRRRLGCAPRRCAPSPAATASLEIARHLVAEVARVRG